MGVFPHPPSEETKAKFLAAQALRQPGGPLAETCGAGTGAGAPCGGVPVPNGNGRCIRHCGTTVARAFRARQEKEFLAGRLAPDDWHRFEGRRASNRLRDKWKKNQWYAGRTIDLGSAEADFLNQCWAQGVDTAPLAPAVVDWCRWKYKRKIIDLKQPSRFAATLRDELPARIKAAGARPAADSDIMLTQPDPRQMWCYKAKLPRAGSRRAQPDRPRTAPTAPPDTSSPRRARGWPKDMKRRKKIEPEFLYISEDELADVVSAHSATLLPLFKKCRSDEDRKQVALAFARMLAVPDCAGTAAAWRSTIKELVAQR